MAYGLLTLLCFLFVCVFFAPPIPFLVVGFFLLEWGVESPVGVNSSLLTPPQK